MNCPETEPLLHPYLDGELDLMTAVRVEEHLAACPACARQYRDLEELRREIAAASLDFTPKPGLARRIRKISQPRWRRPAAWSALAAAAVLAVVFLRPAAPATDRELLDNHIRSLMASHLVDVPSSDQHTVKPWFQGRLSFSPNVPDLAAQGFELTGGRLDVVRRAPACAIVYKRRQHVINLFVLPENRPDSPPREQSNEGYNLVAWSKAGMSYWAVSDLNRAELLQFADLFRTR